MRNFANLHRLSQLFWLCSDRAEKGEEAYVTRHCMQQCPPCRHRVALTGAGKFLKSRKGEELYNDFCALAASIPVFIRCCESWGPVAMLRHGQAVSLGADGLLLQLP